MSERAFEAAAPERPPRPSPTLTALLTAVVLLAFAGNSLLTRAALAGDAIGPLEFTGLRVASGGFALLPFLWRARVRLAPSMAGAASLFAYALCFSLAYLELEAGTGALLLFGAVQLTMIAVGLASGERPSRTRAIGFALAVAGLVWLVAPGVDAPTPWAACSMALAGVAWGAYSLLGRGVTDPTRQTAINFAVATPFALLLLALAGDGHWTARGMLLAITSGAGTSGLGYALWYAALRGHTAISAGIVQLAVPALAALGGALLLGEALGLRLLLSALLTLGGVAVAIVAGPGRPATRSEQRA